MISSYISYIHFQLKLEDALGSIYLMTISSKSCLLKVNIFSLTIVRINTPPIPNESVSQGMAEWTVC